MIKQRNSLLYSLYILCIIVTFFCTNISNAKSQTIKLIFDDEIENMVRDALAPIIQVANIDDEDIHIYIVDDNTINASADNQYNIYVYTGLLRICDSVDMLQAVLAHEIAHVRKQHSTYRMIEQHNTQIHFLLNTALLTLGSAIFSPDLILPTLGITQNAGISRFLQFSRTQELAADNASVEYLSKAGIDLNGILKILTYIQRVKGKGNAQDKYLSSHPLTEERISNIEHLISHTPGYTYVNNDKLQKQLLLSQTKIKAFSQDSKLLTLDLNHHPNQYQLYEHAIVAFRLGKKAESLNTVQQLITAYPNNPYFHELQGYIYSSFHNIDEALSAYKKAYDLMPDSYSFNLETGRISFIKATNTTISGKIQNNAKYIGDALMHLNFCNNINPNLALIHHMLATLYNKSGNTERSLYHLAYNEMLTNKDTHKIAIWLEQAVQTSDHVLKNKIHDLYLMVDIDPPSNTMYYK